MTNGMH